MLPDYYWSGEGMGGGRCCVLLLYNYIAWSCLTFFPPFKTLQPFPLFRFDVLRVPCAPIAAGNTLADSQALCLFSIGIIFSITIITLSNLCKSLVLGEWRWLFPSPFPVLCSYAVIMGPGSSVCSSFKGTLMDHSPLPWHQTKSCEVVKGLKG